MANIIDYVKWRGDVPYSVDPFNEVDNLIFAELAYIDFVGIVDGPESSDCLTLKEAAELFFHENTMEEALKKNPAPYTLEAVKDAPRFQNTRVRWYISKLDEEAERQLAIVTFELEDGSSYVAMRGTDGTLVGWKEDFNMAYMAGTAGQLGAVDYLNAHFAEGDRPLRIGGHSKGGNFAMYAAIFCNEPIREKIRWVYSNDGPGFRKQILNTSNYREMSARIYSIIPEDSIVGMLLHNNVKHHVVKSEGSGFNQHDLNNWQLEKNRLLRAEKLSDGSEMLNEVLTTWLEALSDEEIEVFVNGIFDSLNAAGVSTFQEMSEEKLKCYGAALKAAGDLPKEKQQVIKDTIGKLASVGKDVISNSVSDMVSGVFPIW